MGVCIDMICMHNAYTKVTIKKTLEKLFLHETWKKNYLTKKYRAKQEKNIGGFPLPKKQKSNKRKIYEKWLKEKQIVERWRNQIQARPWDQDPTNHLAKL